MIMNSVAGWEFFEGVLLKSSARAAVLVLLVLAVQWLFRRKLAPRWRYALWWLVVIRLMLPVSPESAVSVFNWIRWQEARLRPVATSAELDRASRAQDTPTPAPGVIQLNPHWPMNAIPTAPALELDTQEAATRPANAPAARTAGLPAARLAISWRQVLLWGWCLGAVALAGHVGWSVLRLRRWLRAATPLSDPRVLEVLDRCREQMRTGRRLTLLETPAVNSPALCGLWRPRLLLPPGLIDRFTEQELRFVFLHELAHLKRHDIAVNWLTTLLQIVHWFNPLIWLAFHRMRADRELACDARVLSAAQREESRAYGATIIKLLEGIVRPAPLPGLVGILEDKSQMKRRMRSIANFRGAPRVSLVALALLGVLAAVGLTDARSEKRSASPTPASQTRQAATGAGYTSFHLSLAWDSKLPLGEYDSGFVNAIHRRCNERQQDRPAPGKQSSQCVLGFRLAEDGSLSAIRIIESDAEESMTALCRQALTEVSPYKPWSPEMRRAVGQLHREGHLTIHVSTVRTIGGSLPTTWVNRVPSDLKIPEAHGPAPNPGGDRKSHEQTKDGRVLRGRVVDENGEPLPQVFTGLAGRRSVVTDARGRFEIADAPPSADYYFHGPGVAFGTKKTLLAVGDSEHVITLRRKIRIRGTVRDAETRAPIEAFSVVPGEMSAARPGVSWLWTESRRGTDGAIDLTLAGSQFPAATAARLMVEADGYTPALSKDLAFEDAEQTVNVSLRKGEPINGVVLQPDGSRAKWANVFLWLGELNLQDIPYRHYHQTDATGEFSFKPALVQTILVKHDRGFAMLTPEQLRASPQVRLRPGGRVNGTVRFGGKPAAYRRVSLQPLHYKYEPRLPDQFSSVRDETDSQGRFRLGGVPEGEYWLAVQHPQEWQFGSGAGMATVFTHSLPVFVGWGSTTNVDFGGIGRRVVGRPAFGKATAEDDGKAIRWLDCSGALTLKLPEVPGLPEITRYDSPGVEGPASEAAKAFWLSPEGKARQRAVRTYVAAFAEDGTFRIDDVPPGTYRLQLSVFGRAGRESLYTGGPAFRVEWGGGQSHGLEREVVVPPTIGDRSDEPLDLGVLPLEAASSRQP